MAHVLVVEDDAKLAGLLSRALDLAGHRTAVAGSGDQALWAFQSAPFDALVLDVMIPHPSGIELCRHFRAHGFRRPIVVTSARTGNDHRDTALRAGADRFLPKPFALAELTAVLDALLATERERVGLPDA